MTAAGVGRRSRHELKELILDAAVEVLADVRPTMGFEHLTYKRVFDHLHDTHGLRVTTASVHERIWSSQREFQLEAVATAIGAIPDEIFDVGATGAARVLDRADLDTVPGRRRAVQDLVRTLQNRGWELGAAATAHDALWLAARFRYATIPPDDPEALAFSELILTHRQRNTELFVEMMRAVMQTVGLRFRAGFDDDPAQRLAVLGNAATIGLLTDVMPEASAMRSYPSGPGGSLEDWSPPALALWFLVCAVIELDGAEGADPTLTSPGSPWVVE